MIILFVRLIVGRSINYSMRSLRCDWILYNKIYTKEKNGKNVSSYTQSMSIFKNNGFFYNNDKNRMYEKKF